MNLLHLPKFFILSITVHNARTAPLKFIKQINNYSEIQKIPHVLKECGYEAKRN